MGGTARVIPLTSAADPQVQGNQAEVRPRAAQDRPARPASRSPGTPHSGRAAAVTDSGRTSREAARSAATSGRAAA